MTEDRFNQIIKELDKIRQSRKERGTLFLEVVLESSKNIRDRYIKWYDKAINELYQEIDLMNELVPYEELEEQKKKLDNMNLRYENNKKALEKFITAIEKGNIKSFEELEVTETKPTFPSISEVPLMDEKGISFSAVTNALEIAQDIENIEKSVEKISRFMGNVILLTRKFPARRQI